MLASSVGSCWVKLAARSNARSTWSRNLAPRDTGTLLAAGGEGHESYVDTGSGARGGAGYGVCGFSVIPHHVYARAVSPGVPRRLARQSRPSELAGRHAGGRPRRGAEIGRASCRERV